MTLVVLFLITLVTGVILHLKKHGIIIEPRPVIKIVHWVAGIGMTALACLHGAQFWNMFGAMKKKFAWFWCDTWAVIVLGGIAFVTGMVKLLSPVKIPNLGLWHYWFGILMTVAIAVHLIRGIPGWNRMRKIKQPK